MFNDNITVMVWNDKKSKVLEIIQKYTNGTIHIDNSDSIIEIKFRVNKLKTRKVIKCLGTDIVGLYINSI